MINWLGGDFRFFWPENVGFFARIPSAWDASLNTGIGMPAMNTLWLTSYLNLTAYLSHFGLSWNVISLVFWIIPFVAISFFSSFFLFRFLISKNKFFAVLAGIIYTTNTYFLSVFFGGQVGVCFAYAFVPLVVLLFLKLLQKTNLYYSLLFSLVFSLEFFFDPRFTLITVFILGLYYVLRLKFYLKDFVYLAVLPAVSTILLNAFWILPSVIFRENIVQQLGAAYNSLAIVKFFSFATFENGLSLLHPNWPENLFGKVYFMRPEFLVLPILTFSSLLFLGGKVQKNIERSNVLFFALLGLVGAFLAKGANDPFGGLYLWMFAHVPGFVLFRDSTKFYVLVALAYSVLIPFSLHKISEYVSGRKYHVVSNKFFIPGLFLLFWIFSLRLLVTTNNLKLNYVPNGYVQLKDFIVSQDTFFRTLWVPSWQRYGYFSDLNPAIGRGELFKDASASGMITALKQPKTTEMLSDMGVKYIIIPEDSKGEIFTNDRKYDEKVYQQTVFGIAKIHMMREVAKFGKIIVFEIPNARDRFWNATTKQNVSYQMISPTKYVLHLSNVKQGERIIFSDSFDKYWIAENSEFKVQSLEFNSKMNSFILPKQGTYDLTVYYTPQKWVEIGLFVSGVMFVLLIGYLVTRRKKV